ncbi:MAG: hypothetical protein M3116_06990 [Actinomycetota bacterium]|nr:hypothetical protein [Actinomycetota bacterium]
MTDDGGTDRDQVRVRRAPRYSAFLAVGGALGALVALVLTTTREVDPEVGVLQMFLFLALFGVTIGMLLGGIAALAFDRASSRRAATVTAERSEVAPAHQPVTEPAIEALPDEAQEPTDADAPAEGDDRPEQPQPRS